MYSRSKGPVKSSNTLRPESESFNTQIIERPPFFGLSALSPEPSPSLLIPNQRVYGDEFYTLAKRTHYCQQKGPIKPVESSAIFFSVPKLSVSLIV